MFGESVKGLSPATTARRKSGWEREYAQWRERDWHGEEFVYLRKDGSYVNVRGEERLTPWCERWIEFVPPGC